MKLILAVNFSSNRNIRPPYFTGKFSWYKLSANVIWRFNFFCGSGGSNYGTPGPTGGNYCVIVKIKFHLGNDQKIKGIVRE